MYDPMDCDNYLLDMQDRYAKRHDVDVKPARQEFYFDPILGIVFQGNGADKVRETIVKEVPNKPPVNVNTK